MSWWLHSSNTVPQEERDVLRGSFSSVGNRPTDRPSSGVGARQTAAGRVLNQVAAVRWRLRLRSAWEDRRAVTSAQGHRVLLSAVRKDPRCWRGSCDGISDNNKRIYVRASKHSVQKVIRDPVPEHLVLVRQSGPIVGLSVDQLSLGPAAVASCYLLAQVCTLLHTYCRQKLNIRFYQV